MRKELHFFDDDLRYTRGLAFYAAHFPRCARDAAASASPPQYWPRAPSSGVEVLLEDARSGEAVGWDAELNVPTNAHNSLLLEPARYEVRNGSAAAAAAAAASLPHSGARQMYRLVDAATSQQLYLRGWVVRAAPLSQPDDASQRFYLLPVPRRRGGSRGAQGGGRRRAGEGERGREDGRRLAEGKGGARLIERRRSGGGARRGDRQAKHGSGKRQQRQQRQQRQRKAGARHGAADAGKGRGRRGKAGEQPGRIGGGRAQGGNGGGGGGGGGGDGGGARAFWLVDVATGRMLYWRDDAF